jgi:hypothetical protein
MVGRDFSSTAIATHPAAEGSHLVRIRLGGLTSQLNDERGMAAQPLARCRSHVPLISG